MILETGLRKVILDSARSYSHENFVMGSKDEIMAVRDELVNEGLIEPKTIFVLTDKGRKAMSQMTRAA
jgi:hypothetical protein